MPIGDSWDPERYERFREERRQPFLDLLALVRRAEGMRVVDLGCGTGELTAQLHRELGARETVGIDSSAAMLARSGQYASEGLRFEQGDIETWRPATPGSLELVFSNAALHWVGDHERLFARLASALAPGGQLAVQVPASYGHPLYSVAAAIGQELPFRQVLGGHVFRSPVLAPQEYATLLHRLGFCEQHVRLQVYGHLLGSREDVVEWGRGALLTDYQKRMDEATFARFLERYRERMLEEFEDTRPLFFPFNRVLLWARR